MFRKVFFIFSVFYFLLFYGVFLLCPFSISYSSSENQLSLIRDAEIEEILHDYINPIFKTAGLDPRFLNLYLIKDSNINAFATSNYSIFINTGLILNSKSPEEIIFVLAHETGHIAGNHIGNLQKFQDKSGFAMLASLALGVGMAALSPEAAMAIMMGNTSSLQRLYMHYSRGQEGIADSLALQYLDKLHWSCQGGFDFMKILAQSEFISSDHQDLYMRTHPFSRDRLDFLEQHLQKSLYRKAQLPQDFYDKYDRMMAKLSAYTIPPIKTLLYYSSEDLTLRAKYARTIAFYRQGDVEQALQNLENLIQSYPYDPYFWELKGQFFFEKGDLNKAKTAYQKALQINPKTPLIHYAYAKTLIEMNQKKFNQEAIYHLRQVLDSEKQNTQAWQLLAITYGRENNLALSYLALAEKELANFEPQKALSQIKRTLAFLSKNSPDYIRALDIENLAQQLIKEQT